MEVLKYVYVLHFDVNKEINFKHERLSAIEIIEYILSTHMGYLPYDESNIPYKPGNMIPNINAEIDRVLGFLITNCKFPFDTWYYSVTEQYNYVIIILYKDRNSV